MRTTLLAVVALSCAAAVALAGQHRNPDGSISDDVLIQSNGLAVGPSNPLPVAQPDLRGTGSLAAASLNAAYTLALNNGEGVVGFSVTGLTGSGATLVPEASNDGGTSWSTINAVAPSTGTLLTALTVNQQVRVNAGGHTNLRLRVSTAGSGTIAIASTASLGAPLVTLSAPLPPGQNLIGAVQTPIPATIVAGQVKIVATGAAVQLPPNPLVNGIAIKCAATNAGNVFVGPSTVTTLYDGTGNGFPIEPGGGASFATSNSNAAYLNGAAGSVCSFEGN